MRYIAYFTSERSALSGTFSPLLWILDVATGGTRVIDSVSTPAVAWSPDGQYVAYVPLNMDMVVIVAAETGYIPDFVRAFAGSPSAMIVGQRVSDPVFSPEGTKLLFVDREQQTDTTTVNYRDLTSGEVRTLDTFPDDNIRFEDVRWLSSGIIIVEDRAPSSYVDDIVFHHIDPATGKHTELNTLLTEDYIRMVEW
jgi:hypothetical protein